MLLVVAPWATGAAGATGATGYELPPENKTNAAPMTTIEQITRAAMTR